MISKFGKLVSVLRFAYPYIEWDERRFSLRAKKVAQRFYSL